jgi:tetratricopeptide (TPR) repeat protein
VNTRLPVTMTRSRPSSSPLIHRVLAAMLAVTVPATAVLAPPAAAAARGGDKKKQAKAYVDAGLAAQEGGDFDAAVDFYQKAYALVPHPTLFFNIAQAYRLGQKPVEALDYYRRFLDVESKGDQAKIAAGFVKELEPVVAKLEADKKAADEAAAEAERQRLAAEEKRKADEAAALDKGKKPPPPDDDDDDDDDGDRIGPPDDDDDDDATPPPSGGGMGGKRIAGLTLGGLGLVGIGAGVIFGLKAKGISDDLSEPGATFDPQKVDDGEAANRNMFIGYGVGAALLVTGVVLYVMGGKSNAESSTAVSLTPTVAPDGSAAGLVLAGGF